VYGFVLLQTSEARCSESIELHSTALQYATHLLPFASFLHTKRQLWAIALSLVVELPQTAETASCLAELFPNADCLDAETRNQLDWILEEWQGLIAMDKQQPGGNVDINVTGSKGPTLATIYHEKVDDHKRQLDKRRQTFGACHENIFTAGNTELNYLFVGSWPFEGCSDFLVCLDTFYSISFGSCIESEATELPLIAAFASSVCQAQLDLLPANVTKEPKFTQVVSSPRVRSRVATNFDIVKDTALPKSQAKGKRDLFHNCSVSETDLNMSRESGGILQRTSSKSAEVDVLVSSSAVDITDSARLHAELQNTNNNNSNTLRSSPVKVGNSNGLDLIDSVVSDNDHVRPPAFVDYLSESVLPLAIIERLEFGGEIAETERLAEWLNGWAVRQRDWDNAVRPSAALRVRVSPQMLAYSLWLVDSCCQKHRFTPGVGRDVTVAMVHSTQMPASSPREPFAKSSLGMVEATSNHHSSRTQSPGTAGQEVLEDQVKEDRKGCKKKSGKKSVHHKDDLHDEIVVGVNQKTWLWEASSLQQGHSETENRSANNNVDRYDFVIIYIIHTQAEFIICTKCLSFITCTNCPSNWQNEICRWAVTSVMLNEGIKKQQQSNMF